MKTILCLALLALPALAGDDFTSRLDLRDFRRVAVLENGRKKPLDTFAREKLEFITGKATWHGEDPVATILSMVMETEKWETAEFFKVSHPEVVQLLDLKRDGKLRNVFTFRELMGSVKFMGEMHKLEEAGAKATTPRGKALEEIRVKLVYFARLKQMLNIVPPPQGYPKDDWYVFEENPHEGGWKVIGAPRELYAAGWIEKTEEEWAALAKAIRGRDHGTANRLMASLAKRLAEVNPDAYPAPSMLSVENAYMRWRPLTAAWIVYFLSCTLFAFGMGLDSQKLRKGGFILLCTAFAAHLAAVGMRGYVAQRAPWADLYEAMVVVALMCVVFAIVFEAIHRTAYVGLSAAFMAGVGLVGASMMPFDFRTIDPLVPVLRSWWLKYHVLAMIASYGAFSLAFGISLIHLVAHFVRKDVVASKKLEDLTYRVIQVGFFFITVGIILGAVWADSAWGRYWGWDPKEIWALVSWFIYGAYIHGRMIGWCRGIRAAGASVLGYAAILFTFFGVNFVLTGLHSYANPS